MDVLTLKNKVALAGVKLLAGLTYCSLQLEEIMLNVASSPGKTHQGTFGAVPALLAQLNLQLANIIHQSKITVQIRCIIASINWWKIWLLNCMP